MFGSPTQPNFRWLVAPTADSQTPVEAVTPVQKLEFFSRLNKHFPAS